MKCYEALASALVAEKVEVVFGLIGGEVAYLAQAMVDQHKVRFVAVRHEEVAVGMADGYSRATGKVGVAVVCLGPGLTNACSPMVAARKANSRLLVICGGSPEERNGRLPGQPMHIDQPPLIDASIGAHRTCRTPQTLSEDVALTFRHLRLNKGPIALLFQEDLALLDAPDTWTYEPRGRAEVQPDVAGVRRQDVADIAARFQAAQRPVILAGRGAVLAGARPELTALAERTGSLLVTSLLAREWFAGDPYNLGVSGGFSTAGSAEILQQADLVVAFGATLNDSTLRHGTLYSKARMVQIDDDPAAIDDLNRVDLGVVADARAMAQALSMTLQPTTRPGWRDEAMARRIAAIDRWRERDMTDRSGGANPRGVVDALDKALPKNRLVLTDIGLFMGVPGAYMTVASPADLILPWQYGRMGGCLPIAMGAALGRPDQTTVAFLGDGGFMAAVHALETLKAENLPVVAVVMDDGGFGAERRAFAHHKQGESTADYAVVDIPALAASLGLKGHRVRSAGEMRRLAASGALHGGPVVVQVIVDRETPPTEMIAAGWA